MKLHPIFSKEFSIWWAVMAIVSFIKFYFLGIPVEKGLEQYGIIFWVLGAMFTGLILGSILYLIYRLISGKWNNKAFIILITIAWFIILMTRMNAPTNLITNVMGFI